MPGPLLVTNIDSRLQRMSIPTAAGMPDVLQLPTGSLGDPLAVARITFDGQDVEALGAVTQVVVVVPVLDLLHLREIVDAAIANSERDGTLRLADEDRR